MSPFWILSELITMEVAVTMLQSSSQIVTVSKPTPSLLQLAGCPSSRPTNNVKALKGKIKTRTD